MLIFSDTYQADVGYANLHGVDYSPAAVALAVEVAGNEGREGIGFSVLDLTDPAGVPEDMVASWDLVVDKGTFDGLFGAVVLSLGVMVLTHLRHNSHHAFDPHRRSKAHDTLPTNGR